jgi:hypothetical protein
VTTIDVVLSKTTYCAALRAAISLSGSQWQGASPLLPPPIRQAAGKYLGLCSAWINNLFWRRIMLKNLGVNGVLCRGRGWGVFLPLNRTLSELPHSLLQEAPSPLGISSDSDCLRLDLFQNVSGWVRETLNPRQIFQADGLHSVQLFCF